MSVKKMHEEPVKHLLGKARRLFYGRDGGTRHAAMYTLAYPLLEKLYAAGNLQYGELFFAESLTGGQATQGQWALFCYLLRASQEGHLCVRLLPLLDPSPRLFWETTEKVLLGEEWERLEKEIQQAFLALPPLASVTRYHEHLYLQRNWHYESEIVTALSLKMQAKPHLAIDINLLSQKIKQSSALSSEQGTAAFMALSHAFSIITGGPGSGKTYTVAQMIRLMNECKIVPGLTIALAAPTGKAAALLQSSISSYLKDATCLHLLAKTLHAFLQKGGEELGSADIVIVDESSMMDVKLMARLFREVPAHVPLIFLGDSNQLPPVESGNLFADFCTFASSSTALAMTCLSRSHRCSQKDLIAFSDFVMAGDCKAALRCLQQKREALHWIDIEGRPPYLLLEHLVQQYSQHFEQDRSFCLLSPLKKGPLGADEINRAFLQNAHYRVKEGQKLRLPIIITSNDYRKGLFNGEAGRLHFKKGESPRAVFPQRGVEKQRCIPLSHLPPFEYAFCLSVHKSQGSEFDEIALLMPEKSQRFGRQVLYTAVTRARKSVTIFAPRKVLEEAMETKCHRQSNLVSRLTLC